MKKILFSVLALGLAFSSCSNVEDEGVSNGAKQTVNFELSAPEAFAEGTRAGDYVNSAKGGVTNLAGETITYHLAFYYGNDVEWSGTQTSTATSVKFQPELIIGESYQLVAYATFGGEQADLTNIAVSSGINNEANDAYSCTKDVEASLTMSATLTRPSAKLRFLAKDYETGKAHGFNITKVSVEYTNGYAETFNAYNGQYGAAGTTKTSEAAAVEYTQTENTVFTDYIPVNADVEETIKVFVTYTDAGGANNTREFDFTPVPLKRNYLTTIKANVWKEQAEVEIIIDEALGEIWDGSSVKEPQKNAEGQYVIATASELAWVAQQTANGVNFKGQTIVQTADIYLGYNEWTPIGNSTTTFQGVYDGGGYTINDLKIDNNASYIGLFGYTTNGEIKNVHVNNANIKGRLGVGVVSGCPYTSKYTNIKVTGLVTVDAAFYVGGVLGRNAYANLTNITVDVEDGSYVKANSVEDGIAYRTYVGGVVGFIGEGGHKMSNITSNIDVIGTTIDVGGIAGIAQYGNTFENCSSSGDVEITAAEDAGDAEQIGGIAAVWNNKTGHKVTFTNCQFTGTLKTNITGVDLTDNTIVGAAYDKTGEGELIIDGKVVAGGATTITTANIADVLSNISAGDKVTLKATEDISFSEKLTIPADATVTLDLNGKTMTVKAGNGVENYLANSGTLTIKGGTITGEDNENSRKCIYNNVGGNMTLDGVTVIETYKAKGAAVNNYGKMTIKNTSITSGASSVWTEGDGAETFIEAGTEINSDGSAGYNYGVQTLNGGKTTINGGTFVGVFGNCSVSGANAELIINGGQFDNNSGNSTRYCVYVGTDGKATVKNGKFAVEGNEAITFGSYGTLYVYGGLYERTAGNWGITNNVTWVNSGDANYPYTPQK